MRRHGIESSLVQGREDQHREAVAPLLHAVVQDPVHLEITGLEAGQRAVGGEGLEREIFGIGEKRPVAAGRFPEKSQVQETRLARLEALHFLRDPGLVGQVEVIVAAIFKTADLVDHQVVENGGVVLVDDDVDDQVEKDRDQHDGRDDEEQRRDDEPVADLPEQAAA